MIIIIILFFVSKYQSCLLHLREREFQHQQGK